MQFTQTPLSGAWLIEMDRLEDERGYFARSFCEEEFGRRGLVSRWVQCNVSFNRLRGTVRGMHFQVHPKGEPKLVRCTRGAIHDVIVDLRPDSPTYLRSYGVDLTAENGRMLYIPVGLAHGFQTLEDRTEVFYQMGEFFSPEHARGVRWNDPRLKVEFPLPVSVISPKDLGYPDLVD